VSDQVSHPEKTKRKIIVLYISYVAKNFIKVGKLRCTGFTRDSTAYLNGMQLSPCTATNLFSFKATCVYCQTVYQGTDTNGYCSSLLSPDVWAIRSPCKLTIQAHNTAINTSYIQLSKHAKCSRKAMRVLSTMA
jgi:hypothetical protein